MATQLLITAAEVISLAIPNKNFRPEWIKDSIIRLVQEKYLYPVLGGDDLTAATDNLYNRLMLTAYNTLTTEEKTLVDDYIKPALAYYVKYQIIPDVFTQLTNAGIQSNTMEHSGTVSSSDKNVLRAQAKEDAETYMGVMVRWIEDNLTYFPLYSSSNNRRITFTHAGGIIFKRRT